MRFDIIQKTALLFAAATALVATGGLGCNKMVTTALTADPDAIVGDYGDAPDILASKYPSGITAEFLTRFGKNGAHHRDVTDSAFGAFKPDGSLSVSAEKDALDPADPDGIQNIDEPTGESDRDAFDDGLLSPVMAPGVGNSIDFLVSVAPAAPTVTRYVNMLADWDQNGYWVDKAGLPPEWIVVNMPVDVTPGTTAALTTPEFMAGAHSNVWLRMTLSEKPIDPAAYPDGWNGEGEFAIGETEDYLLEDHTALDLGGMIIGGGGPGGGGPGGGGPGGGGPGGGGPGGGGPGGGGGGETCEFYKTYNVTLCKGQSRNFLALVDGFAPDSVSADSSDGSTAGVEVNEANVTISGDAVGSSTVDVTIRSGDCVWHITVNVTVKDCSEKKAKIDCCTPAEIAKDPSRCKNCHAVGWAIYTNETPGGGGDSVNGGIELTGSHGDTNANLKTKTTVVKIGNVIKIIVTFYQCDPCPDPDGEIADEDGNGEDDDGDCDDDKIPNEDDWFPEQPYDPSNPHDYEEQQFVDSFFDVFFDVNTHHEVFDQRDFSEQPYEYQLYEYDAYEMVNR